MSYEKGSFKYAVIPDMEELEWLKRTNAELLEALKDIVRASDHLQEPSFEAKIALKAIVKAEGK